MGTKQLLTAILDLHPEDRAELLRVVEDRTSAELTASIEAPEFIDDLDRRYNRWVKNPSTGTPWEQVNREMKALIQKINRDRGRSKSTTSRKSNSRRPSSTTK